MFYQIHLIGNNQLQKEIWKSKKEFLVKKVLKFLQ